MTALIIAAANGRDGCVALLVSAGAKARVRHADIMRCHV
jgi:hypothetical protein